MIHPPHDRVVPAPFWDEVRGYNLATLRFDLQAGATVAVFAVPQAMACAVLAGLPPVHGLYAAVVMSVVAALWGSSRFVNTGPTNSAALLTAASLLPFLSPGDPWPMVFQFTLLVGLIRMGMGLLRLGWLIRFVPESAFLGFMEAAGILIALGQPHHLLGVAAPQQTSFALRLMDVLSRVREANLYAASIGMGTFVLMLLLDRYAKRFPVALVVIGAATVLVQLLGEDSGVKLLRDVAPVPGGLPAPHLYPLDLSLAGQMLPGAFAVAVIGLIEAVSIGQMLALKYRQHLNYNQEFFGQGLSQVVGAFFQGFPGSGSFSRTALAEASGARTRLANVYFSAVTALALLFFARWMDLIPMASLAGMLLFVGFKFIHVRDIQRVFDTSSADAAVLVVTFLVTLFGRIEYGFFAGLVTAMAFFLNNARDLQLYELVPHSERGFEERPYTPGSEHERSDVVALTLHGDLFFGVARALRDQLNEIVRVQEPRFILVRTRRAHSIDYSCWNAIFEFAQAFQMSGGKLYLSGVRPELARIIAEADMQHVLPTEQLIAHTETPWQAFGQTVSRVSEQLTPDIYLSVAWREHMLHLQNRQSISHWKDPLCDPATLGAVPLPEREGK